MLEVRLNRGRPLLVLPLAVREGTGRPSPGTASEAVRATRPVAFSLLIETVDSDRPKRKDGMKCDFLFSVSGEEVGDSTSAVAAADGDFWKPSSSSEQKPSSMGPCPMSLRTVPTPSVYISFRDPWDQTNFEQDSLEEQ